MTHPLPFTTQNTARAALFRDEPKNAALAIMRCNIHKKRVSEKSETLYPLSGRRGSNSRPSAWKADALSTELLPQLLSGRRWIRTTEGINQQIYSLPHLATLVFARFSNAMQR